MSRAVPLASDRQIERIVTTALIPYAKNSRVHDEAQVGQIAASIREFGFTNPVLIDDANGIVAGHGRVLAAIKLGLEEVPCIRLTGLTDLQRQAYVIADNKLALNAGWDDEMLRLELAELEAADFDLSLIGFSEEELAALKVEEVPPGLTDADDVPPVPDVPISRLGDVWVLGRHRIVCGDSTDPLVVAKALNGVVPHLMVTDPPYGVNYDPAWRSKSLNAGKRSTGVVHNDMRADWQEAWALFPGDVAYVWHGGLGATIVEQGLAAADFEVRSQIIWAKDVLVVSRGHYHGRHEPCWYAVRKGATGHWQGDRKQSTLWEIKNARGAAGQRDDVRTGHSTQKPVECMKRPIENNSSPGQAVYEPFSGSGTTIIAAEMTGRACHAIELSPAYVDVAVKRWQEFTGKQARHEATGATFAEVAATPAAAVAEAA